jgi:hypothetical protein
MTQITTPTSVNFLYRFEAGSQVLRFTDVAETQTYNDEDYDFSYPITHSRPKFSAEPSESEVDVSVHEGSPLSDIFIDGPPAYQIILRIFEYDRDSGLVTPYYKGWVVRSNFELDKSLLSLHLKTLWHYFERESISDPLTALSRYNIYDPRAGVDFESLRETITVTDLNDERDILTIIGTAQADDWYKGGMIVAPDNDKRGIIKHVTEGGDKKLYLTSAFPRFTLASGFAATVYPGDDLTYETWANKYAAQTNNGEKHGGWQHTPNVDPAVRGVI